MPVSTTNAANAASAADDSLAKSLSDAELFYDQTAGWKIGYVTFNTSDGDPGEGTMSFRIELEVHLV